MEDDSKKELLIRGILILIGAVLFIYGFYFLFQKLNPLIQTFIVGEFSFTDLESISWIGPIIIIITGYLIYNFGRKWRNFIKGISALFLSIGILSLSISIIFYSINSNSENLVGAIQPSLDSIVVESIEDVITNQIDIRDGEKVNLILSSNTQTKTLYNINLSVSDTKYFENIINSFFGENNLDSSQQIKFSKIIISEIYSEISQNNPEILKIGIPLSTFESSIENELENIDQLLLENIDSFGLSEEQKLLISFFDSEEILDYLRNNPNLFLESYEINNEAYLKITIFENEEKRIVEIGNLKVETIGLIWKNLNLNDSSSLENKRMIINIVLSIMISELEKQNLENLDVPVSTISEVVPNEVKSILSYELFGDDIEKKEESLVMIRDDCKQNNIEELQEICQGILMTEYSYFMQNFEEINQLNVEQVGNDLLPFEFNTTNIDSEKKLNNIISEKTNSWKKYFIFFILFFLIAIGIYISHYKIFKEDLDLKNVGYQISKINLSQFIPTFIIIFIIYYVVAFTNLIENFLSKMGEETTNMSTMILDLELFKVFFDIFDTIVFLHAIYLILSIIIFIVFFILLKKKSNINDIV